MDRGIEFVRNVASLAPSAPGAEGGLSAVRKAMEYQEGCDTVSG
jgi:hypothetical protein